MVGIKYYCCTHAAACQATANLVISRPLNLRLYIFLNAVSYILQKLKIQLIWNIVITMNKGEVVGMSGKTEVRFYKAVIAQQHEQK